MPASRRRLRGGLPAALVVAAAGMVCAAPAAGAPAGDWNRDDQRAVAAAGLMAPAPDGGFHGERPLGAGDLRAALAALAARSGEQAVAVRDGPVTVAGFDRLLVEQLGLADVASSVRREAARAGLAPPGRFGDEVVARLLGLRFNHPAGHDERELFPTDPITRAEAAHSLARVLSFSGWEVERAREVLGRFSLPAYAPAQRRALRLAVSKIGMPYVWGGESDTRSSRFGPQAHGGYDCSGFVWRVFKLSGHPAGRRIRGRTAAQQAGEVRRSRRVPLEAVRPADLVFFGPARFGDRATERGVNHTGIALSGDFMIHSSAQGVFVSPLFEEWRRAAFSWARRVV